MGIFLALLSSFVVIADLEARPISYSGGSTVMALSNEMKNAVYYHYSPSHKYSLGLEIGDDETENDNIEEQIQPLRQQFMDNCLVGLVSRSSFHSNMHFYQLLLQNRVNMAPAFHRAVDVGNLEAIKILKSDVSGI